MVYQARLSHGRNMPPATRGPGQPVNNGDSPSVVRVCPTRLQFPKVCPSWVLHSRIHFPCWPTPWYRLVTSLQHLNLSLQLSSFILTPNPPGPLFSFQLWLLPLGTPLPISMLTVTSTKTHTQTKTQPRPVLASSPPCHLSPL